MKIVWKKIFECVALSGVMLAGWGFYQAHADDEVHIGKASATGWIFSIPEVGIEEGIFAKYGVSADDAAVAGDAKVVQAITAGSMDFGLGSGPAMAFTVKGAPMIAVAAFGAEPRDLAITVAANSPIKTPADLKGKLIAVTSVGSLTEWLAKRMAVQQGWGSEGVKLVALGTFQANFAAMKSGQVDAFIGGLDSGYLLEARNEGRVLTGLETYAPHFIAHVLFARAKLVQDNPDLVERFLKGFFGSIAWMKSNRQQSIDFATRLLHQDPVVMAKTYDHEVSMLVDDGHFDPKGIDVLKQSFVDMGMLDKQPSDDQIYTTRFVPVKP